MSPLTKAVNKQLLPIYDKPMIYYPLSVLMLADIKDILIITNPYDEMQFKRLLGDGKQWGINLKYKIQPSPDGLAQAFILGEAFIDNNPCALILGDNLFHGNQLVPQLQDAAVSKGATLFAYKVNDPERYGVVEFDDKNKVVSIEEKPLKPKSNFAVPGLYYYDNSVIDVAKEMKPSARGEYEITDINKYYLSKGLLDVKILTKGSVWLDTGTIKSLMQANQYVQVVEERQGRKIGCIEEAAFFSGFINSEQLLKLADPLVKSGYGEYLKELIDLEKTPFNEG